MVSWPPGPLWGPGWACRTPLLPPGPPRPSRRRCQKLLVSPTLLGRGKVCRGGCREAAPGLLGAGPVPALPCLESELLPTSGSGAHPQRAVWRSGCQMLRRATKSPPPHSPTPPQAWCCPALCSSPSTCSPACHLLPLLPLLSRPAPCMPIPGHRLCVLLAPWSATCRHCLMVPLPGPDPVSPRESGDPLGSHGHAVLCLLPRGGPGG